MSLFLPFWVFSKSSSLGHDLKLKFWHNYSFCIFTRFKMDLYSIFDHQRFTSCKNDSKLRVIARHGYYRVEKVKK